MSRRLHIGGKVRKDGWEVLNISPGPAVDHIGNANDLSMFPDGTFSDVYASHTLEHFDYKSDLGKALTEWGRVLAPGGKIHLSVPDLETLAKLLLDKKNLTADERFHVMRMLFGGHVDAYDYHLVGLNEEFLGHFLAKAGFVDIHRVAKLGFFNDTSEMEFKGHPVSLNMVATKPKEQQLPAPDVPAKGTQKRNATEILAGALKEGPATAGGHGVKVLLVVCRQTCMKSYHLPLGMGLIAASLKQAGHTVAVLNPNHSTEAVDELLLAALDRVQPDLVGFGGMAFHLADIKKMAATTRAHLPSAKIMVGGPVLSNQPHVAMSAVEDAAFGVIGEGEHTSVELADALLANKPFAGIPGLILRSSDCPDGYLVTPPRPIEEDLDALPPVDYEALGLDVYSRLHRPGECAPGLILDENTRVMPILTSRGCPYSCTFCCHESAGRRYRQRSLDKVFAEIEDARQRFGINALFVFDDLFCLKRSRLEEFCKRIAGTGLRWECSMSASQIAPDMLKMMKDAGCCTISVGVESMSDTVLRSMKKGTTKAQVERVLAQVYDAEIGLWSNLIFGDPAETVETALESLEWYANHPEYNFRFAFIGYHPGSKIYDQAVERGLITDPANYLLTMSPEINATSMTDADYNRIRILASRFIQSFGHAGKLIGLDTADSEHLLARIECPYCGTVTTCHSVRSTPGFVPIANCPSCNRGFRAPVIVRLKPSPEAERQTKLIRSLVSENAKVEAIERACHTLLSLDPTSSYAWIVLHSLAKLFRKPVESAISLEHAIAADPYNPGLHERMVETLMGIGVVDAAEKYRKKAAHLRRVGVEETHFVDVILPAQEANRIFDYQLRSLKASIPVASFPIAAKTAAPSEVVTTTR